MLYATFEEEYHSAIISFFTRNKYGKPVLFQELQVGGMFGSSLDFDIDTAEMVNNVCKAHKAIIGVVFTEPAKNRCFYVPIPWKQKRRNVRIPSEKEISQLYENYLQFSENCLNAKI